MSKTRIFAVLGIAILIAAFLTNPKTEQHEGRVTAKAMELMKAQASGSKKDVMRLGMDVFGRVLVQQFVEDNVRVKNYYLFSLTQIRWDNKDVTVGLGLFNKVWLSPKIDEKAKEVVDLIKG